MNLLAGLKDGPIGEIARAAQILGATDPVDVRTPELCGNVAYVSQSRAEELVKMTSKMKITLGKVAGIKAYATDLEFRECWRRKAFRGFVGLTRANLRRICDYFIDHPEAYNQLPDEGELPLTEDDAKWVFERMNEKAFDILLLESMSLEGFAMERLEQEKKEDGPSSSSVSPPAPQNDAVKPMGDANQPT